MKFLFALVLVSIISGCNKNKGYDSWKTIDTFTYGNNKQIDTARNPSYLFVYISPGSNIVFRFNHQEIAPHNVADGDLSEDLYFAIPAGITNFIYTDATLGNASCYFSKMCFCNDLDARPVIAGTIRGTKKSSVTWTINMDILVPGTTNRITFQKDFTLSN
jgi:hypothetical protein